MRFALQFYDDNFKVIYGIQKFLFSKVKTHIAYSTKGNGNYFARSARIYHANHSYVSANFKILIN